MDTSTLSMIGFAISMYVTPGPNNVMLAASAASFGVSATLPHMLGIGLGFTVMLLLVSAGFASASPASFVPLWLVRWVGALWMAWLAWKIAAAPPVQDARGRLMSFPAAMAFQWINPKAWLIALGAASLFLRPDEGLTSFLPRMGVVFAVVSLPCMVPWVVLGAGMRTLLRAPRQARAFNVAMGVLLLASIVPVLWD